MEEGDSSLLYNYSCESTIPLWIPRPFGRKKRYNLSMKMLRFDCVFNVVRLFPRLYITQKGSVYPLPSWEQHDWKLIHSWIVFPMQVTYKPMLEISVVDGDYLIQMMTFLQIQGFSVVSMTDLFSLCYISVLVIFSRSFLVISSHQKCPSLCKKERYIFLAHYWWGIRFELLF